MTGLLHLSVGASRCTAPPGPSVRLPLSDLQKAVFHPPHKCDVQYVVISLEVSGSQLLRVLPNNEIGNSALFSWASQVVQW